MLPTCERYGMGVLVWSPLGGGLLTGRYRKGQEVAVPAGSARLKFSPKQMTDERALDAIEQLVPLAAEAGMPLAHLALAFVVAHPGVTSAIIGPRTMAHLDDQLAGAAVTLDDRILDRIDAIVAPGTDAGMLMADYNPPAITKADLRRRPASEARRGLS